jgi:malonyl-CoA decarboxylase
MTYPIVGDLVKFFGRKRKTGIEDLRLLAEALLSGRGEASGVAIACELLASYAEARADAKLGFLKTLAGRFGPDAARVEQAIVRYQTEPTPKAAMELHNAAEPRRQELIRRLNLAPGGTAALVKMREDLIRSLADHEELDLVDKDFVHLFSSWFNRGFLVVKRIDWTTPAHILEKIIQYEAVHEITSWADLRRRIEPTDRRCFAFFHPTLTDEPLIFVEVALTTGVPAAIAPLLAEDRQPIGPERATTAVFYSISNCQLGLRGVSFGNFLIKQVVEQLKRELPSLGRFVTLSPVPEFAKWLAAERDANRSGFLTTEDKVMLEATDVPGWHRDAAAVRLLKPLLQAAVAQYFLMTKNVAGKPVDPVARFHLYNGARLDRVNWLGDVSAKSMASALGFMVNYLYDPAQIEHNHEAFAQSGTLVASHAVEKLLREKPERVRRRRAAIARTERD